MSKKIAVIGGGASGLFAAIFAAQNGNSVTIYESGERVGRKILADRTCLRFPESSPAPRG